MPISGNILITGGTGTLATAILRQARVERWNTRFTLFARSELRLYQQWRRFSDLNLRTVIGDVRDADAVMAASAGQDVIIHAGAMKRIPECEQQPMECYQTNVLGSRNVAWAAQLRGCAGVAISTDKACAATTTYGASKLLMESIWRGANLTAVRYGNVVASNGSVIPIWQKQWNNGKRLTVTNMHMTRFWMAPSDAVALIMHALDQYTPGGVWVPKMRALSLPTLASYICPGATFDETGVRSTEKIHEDLIAPCEPVTETTTHFLIHAEGMTGTRYSSDRVPTLPRDAFAAMLADAKDLEAL